MGVGIIITASASVQSANLLNTPALWCVRSVWGLRYLHPSGDYTYHLQRCVSKHVDEHRGVCALQVTHHDLQQMQEEEASRREAEARDRALAAKREVTVDSYSRLVDTENVNRQEDAVEARSMEQAIDALSTLAVAPEPASVDKHPEK